MNKAGNVPAGTSGDVHIQEFLDMIAPSVIKFETDHFICGNTYRCVWALREYPTSTDEQAILSHLGEKDGVTLRIYTRHVTPVEERKIISNAASKNRMDRGNTNDLQTTVLAESNLRDVAAIVAQMHHNREPLLHTAVYLELCAHDLDQLKLLQTEVLTELIRSKLNVDRLMLRQQQGFQCVMPTGFNLFRDQFERVLPASSVANLYPFNYSGKTDPQGFYIGRDKFGSNVLVDFNRRADDKTNANILILGNSGQGKSYLLKLLLTNLRESGMRICALDPEMEYEDLTNNLGGCFIDLMGGRYIINPLEPKTWDDAAGPEDMDAPQTFRIRSRLSQHISFLKDFFRSYKDFTDREIDIIEIMLQKLYARWGITDQSDFDSLAPEDYPILSDLYAFMEAEYKAFDASQRQLYTADMLRGILLGLHSMCVGAESKFFNGHTNITDSSFITFGVKGLLQASRSLKDALLFNVLSFMSDELLTVGNTAASLDEFYLFLSNPTAVEYVRNFMKRVRKKDSAVIIASQNLEDFNLDGVREYLAFNGGYLSSRLPADYWMYVEKMQGSFRELDAVLDEINGMAEGGTVDGYRVKAVFYSLFFGAEQPRMNDDDYRGFADCFVTYEEREDEEGKTYMAAVPITDMGTVYGNLSSLLGRGITDENKANAQRIYVLAKYGKAGPGSGLPPGEAMGDGSFAALIAEGEKYLGYPYMWGGSTPETSFDCSGFVCWVYTHSGAYPLSRTTATGIYNQCAIVPKEEAQPGDLVFFSGTYAFGGPVSHVGIYVGGGRMLHCGSPIGYTSIETAYWKEHFFAFGRLLD